MKRVIGLIIWTGRHGLINLYLRAKNRRMFQIIASEEFAVEGTSITDSAYLDSYPTLCGSAAKNGDVFRNFRSSKVMVEALDHVSIDQGKLYLEEILKYGTWSQDFTHVINKIDTLGKPRKFRFAPYGIFSPTLLRYLKVYLDLNKNFGLLQNLNITEIGIGFGGQASLILLLDKPKSYTFYDIPPVLQLAAKFISDLGILGNLNFIDGRNPTGATPDLVFSNYAFSELSLEVQNYYLDRVILNSQRGYITWNSLSADRLGGHSLADLVRLIPNSQILPERPKTAESNVIIIWNNLEIH